MYFVVMKNMILGGPRADVLIGNKEMTLGGPRMGCTV